MIEIVLVSRSLFGVCPSPHIDIDVYSIKINHERSNQTYKFAKNGSYDN